MDLQDIWLMKLFFSLIQRLSDRVFGYDLFVSYSRRGWGEDYPVELVRRLSRPPHEFRCFLDAMSMETGYSWRQQGMQALRKSSKIVLLLTEGALESPGVRDELEFNYRLPPNQRKQISIVNINNSIKKVDKSSDFYKYLTLGEADFDENIFIDEVSRDKPSDGVASRISQDFVLRRENARRLSFMTGSALLMALVTIVAVWLAFQMEAARQESEAGRLAAEAIAATDLDRALLLSVAAFQTKDTLASKRSLFQANLRRERLTKVVPRVGAVENLWLLRVGENPASRPMLLIRYGRTEAPNKHLANAFVLWMFEEPTAKFVVVKGLPEAFRRVIPFPGRNIIAVLQDKEVSFWSLQRDTGNAARLRDFKQRIVVAAPQPDSSRLHFVDDNGRIGVIESSQSRKSRMTALPKEHATAIREAAANSEDSLELAVAPNTGRRAIEVGSAIWLETASKWVRLNPDRSPPDGLAHSGAQFSPHGKLLIAMRSHDTSPSEPLTPAPNAATFVCWNANDGLRQKEGCPSAKRFERARFHGFVGPALLISSADRRTQADLFQLWEPGLNNHLENITLRADRTFTSRVAFDGHGVIAHLSIDDQITIYDRRRFLSGSAKRLHGPIKPVAINWTEQRCDIAYEQLRAGLLVSALLCPRSDRSIPPCRREPEHCKRTRVERPSVRCRRHRVRGA